MASAPFLTVLTAPILPPVTRATRRVRAALRPIVRPGVPLPTVSRYPGHYALVRSVVEGLRANRSDFNFNPVSERAVGRVVYAPANEALRQAIGWKRAGRIDRLVAGPVNALVPDESEGILHSPEIDLIIVACEWARSLFEQAPSLLPKLRVCPCGVDTEVWKPTRPAGQRAVIYWKSGDAAFCDAVEARVSKAGFEPVRFATRHGEHAMFTPERFRDALDGAVVGVFLSSFETQGIALAEAWSMKVPTLVWDPRGPTEWRDHQFQSGGSAPYLTATTGRTWVSLDELDAAMAALPSLRATLAPRDWVLANMTDTGCSARLERIIRAG